MCGIAGYISKEGVSNQVLEKMVVNINHRGPDGNGKWQGHSNGWSIALGHTRLAIIDLTGGYQPFESQDAKFKMIYNGELYNFKKLRIELEAKGFNFKSQSDTEVLLNYFIQHGPKGLINLNGMFAFAVWDEGNKRLTLARDRVGIKPLYYTQLKNGGLVFGSELSALIEHPEVAKQLSPEALTSYFFSDYVQAPLTMIKGIYKLAPASYLVWENGKLNGPINYWKQEAKENNFELNNLKTTLFSTIKEAVANQMVSDVPLGVFLSGGIDSSTVAYFAQENSKQPINTFSIAFEDQSFDESIYAKKVANHIKSNHHEETCSEKILLDTVGPALHHLDEPLADPSYIPTYLLSKITSQHVKVALGGDGGDELFAGYPTYWAHQQASIYEYIPQNIKEHFIPWIVSKIPPSEKYQSLDWKLKRFTLRWDQSPLLRHLRWMSSTDLPDLKKIVSNSNLPLTAQQVSDSASTTTLNSFLMLDFKTYLPGSVLSKVDRASMAWGLEVRPPLLDNTVIDLAFSIPEKLKLNGRSSKYILKETMRPYLPEDIIDRKKKGFAIPLAKWLKGPLDPVLKDAVYDSPLWKASDENPLLNQKVFEQWYLENKQSKFDHSKPLWALLVLDSWIRKVGIHG